MIVKVLGLIFDRNDKNLEKYPKIDELFKECEQVPVPVPKNALPDRKLEELYVQIRPHLDLGSKKIVGMDEIEKFSALYAHQIKNDILRKLVEMGFGEKFGDKVHLRYGKKKSEDYLFLNFRHQKPLPEKVAAVIEDKLDFIDESQLAVVDFISEVRIRDQEFFIKHELVLGHLQLART